MTTTVSIKDKAINTTYAGVTGATSGVGVGATFDVTKTNGTYSAVLKTIGTGYAAGDTITVLGTALGGTVANNLILTVANVGVNGAITKFGSVGTGRVGDGVLDVIVDVDGTAGVDTYTFQGDSTDYTLSFDNSDIVATSNLLNNVEFNLNNYERVVFEDKAVAFDLTNNGAAGQVYSLLAAAFGVADVTDVRMGKALAFKDQGLTVNQLAVSIVNSTDFAQDAGGVSNETFVKNVFLNVMGRASTLSETAHYVGVIENGYKTKADLLVMASNLQDFQTTIDLVGLQTTGVDYTPYTI